jgi:hypothetical protein
MESCKGENHGKKKMGYVIKVELFGIKKGMYSSLICDNGKEWMYIVI